MWSTPMDIKYPVSMKKPALGGLGADADQSGISEDLFS